MCILYPPILPLSLYTRDKIDKIDKNSRKSLIYKRFVFGVFITHPRISYQME